MLQAVISLILIFVIHMNEAMCSLTVLDLSCYIDYYHLSYKRNLPETEGSGSLPWGRIRITLVAFKKCQCPGHNSRCY